MAKRHGDPAYGVKVKVKKRRGIKVRTVAILDSDDEGTSNVDTEYARLLKTRVAISGKAESVTMNSLPLLEVKNTHNDNPLEPCLDTQEPYEAVAENTAPSKPAKKKRKKANDSVRSPTFTNPLLLLTASQTKMRTFLDVRPTVLDDIVSLDGPGNKRHDLCSSCGSIEMTLYRCLECSYSLLCCGECILKLHAILPLHRLEVSPIYGLHLNAPRCSLCLVLEERLFR